MSQSRYRVLVVDDEPQYVWAIQTNLEARGYEVISTRKGAQVVDLVETMLPDLVILDILMPDMDGFEVCRRIRSFSTVPLIMLTALVEHEERVKGLDLGADDYVTKPFSVPELLSRVHAILRRVEFDEQRDPTPVVRAGRLAIDLIQKQAFLDSSPVELSATEFRTLSVLSRHPGQVLTYDRLLERVWGVGYEGQTQLVRQVIHRLRAKIEPDPKNPRYIETKVGLGYVFVIPEE